MFRFSGEKKASHWAEAGVETKVLVGIREG